MLPVKPRDRVTPLGHSPSNKETLDFPLCPLPLLLKGRRPLEGNFLNGFLSQKSHETIREERKAVSNCGIPVAATRIPSPALKLGHLGGWASFPT